MANVTISIDDELLQKSREYAQKHNTSLNALIRKILKQSVSNSSEEWLDECFKIMDNTEADSKGRNWLREDLYDV